MLQPAARSMKQEQNVAKVPAVVLLVVPVIWSMRSQSTEARSIYNDSFLHLVHVVLVDLMLTLFGHFVHRHCVLS